MRKETIEEALSECALFEGIHDSDRNALLGIAMERHLAKKATLFGEGDRAEGFYLILTGSVKVFKISPDGKGRRSFTSSGRESRWARCRSSAARNSPPSPKR